MGLRLDVALHEGSGNELVGDVGAAHVFGQRLVRLLLGPPHRRLVATHEGGIAIVRVERDTTRVHLVEVLPGEFVQAVRLAGAGSADVDEVAGLIWGRKSNRLVAERDVLRKPLEWIPAFLVTLHIVGELGHKIRAEH